MPPKLIKRDLFTHQERLAFYEQAIRFPYEGFMFDIDGTIRERGNLDTRIIEIIFYLNKKNKPVAFVTNGSLEETHELLKTLRGLKNSANVVIYTENGLLAIPLGDWFEGKIADGSLSFKSNDIEQLQKNFDLVMSSFQNCIKRRRFSVEIRLKDFISALQKQLISQGLEIDILDANHSLTLMPRHCSKGFALKHFVDRSKISKSDLVFRIGDQGQHGGNDYEFLNGLGGFSSGNLNPECIFPSPVFNSKGQIFQSTEATYQALKKILDLEHRH